ncbi:Protein of unknown function [Streptococcus thermophilus]|nr:Protein of unknown function [Streptococcus thermophilus]
MATKEK